MDLFYKTIICFLLSLSLTAYSFEFDSKVSENILNINKFKEFEDFLFNSKNHKTDAFLIIAHTKDKNNKIKDIIVYERYENGYTKDSPHLLWSITKSISSLMIGKMIEQGHFRLNDRVAKFYPDLKSKTPKNPIQIQHLLNMLSGLDWNETYESNPLNSNVVSMLYIDGHKDMAKYAIGHKPKYFPGEKFNYSSGETNILMGLARMTLKDKYKDYPWTHFFDPMNIKSATFETDQAQTYVGSSYMYLSARDLSKFGHLIHHKGKYHNKELINQGWINLLSRPSHLFSLKTFKAPKSDEAQRNYSFHWWLNGDLRFPYNQDKPVKRYQFAPANLISAAGHWGQMLDIYPSKGLTFVRFAEDKKEKLDKDKYYQLLDKALK